MSIQSLLHWLSSSAAPGWIFGVLASVFALLQWLRGRMRPSLVVVHQDLAISLESAPEGIPDRVAMNYGDRRVEKAWVTGLRIRNTGHEVISRPVLHIEVDDETTILEGNLGDFPSGEKVLVTITDHRLTIEFPYLNPFALHKQESFLTLVCGGKPEPLAVRGGGRGWAVEWDSFESKRETLLPRLVWTRRLRVVSIILFAAVSAMELLQGVGTTPFGQIMLPLLCIVFGVAHLLCVWWEGELNSLHDYSNSQ